MVDVRACRGRGDIEYAATVGDMKVKGRRTRCRSTVRAGPFRFPPSVPVLWWDPERGRWCEKPPKPDDSSNPYRVIPAGDQVLRVPTVSGRDDRTPPGPGDLWVGSDHRYLVHRYSPAMVFPNQDLTVRGFWDLRPFCAIAELPDLVRFLDWDRLFPPYPPPDGALPEDLTRRLLAATTQLVPTVTGGLDRWVTDWQDLLVQLAGWLPSLPSMAGRPLFPEVYQIPPWAGNLDFPIPLFVVPPMTLRLTPAAPEILYTGAFLPPSGGALVVTGNAPDSRLFGLIHAGRTLELRDLHVGQLRLDLAEDAGYRAVGVSADHVVISGPDMSARPRELRVRDCRWRLLQVDDVTLTNGMVDPGSLGRAEQVELVSVRLDQALLPFGGRATGPAPRGLRDWWSQVRREPDRLHEHPELGPLGLLVTGPRVRGSRPPRFRTPCGTTLMLDRVELSSMILDERVLDAGNVLSVDEGCLVFSDKRPPRHLYRIDRRSTTETTR